jgi:hypothetical protein
MTKRIDRQPGWRRLNSFVAHVGAPNLGNAEFNALGK